MTGLLQTFIYWNLFAGVHQLSWLPCKFLDESVQVNNDGHPERQLVHRDSLLQFSQEGDVPVNPDAITFLLTGSKLDLRRFVAGVDADHLECEMHRYNTEGIHVRWPVQESHEYNRWFSCTLKHAMGLFAVTAFLRQPSEQPPPAQQDFRKWPVIEDREVVTTSASLVVKTQSPSVAVGLGLQQKLHCQFAVDHKRPAVTVKWHWHRRGDRRELFSYVSQSGQTHGTGVGLKGLAGGDASLSLPFTKLSSEGTYVCSVSVNPVFASLDISLRIEEPPRVSLNVGPTLQLQEGDEQKVVCEAEGYYPLDVEIVWYEQEAPSEGRRVGARPPQRLQNVLMSSHKRNVDGTFLLSAFFYLQAAHRHSGRQFTCSVTHQSLRVPVKKTLIVNVEEPSSWLFNVSVGGTLLLLGIVLCLMLRYLHAARKYSLQKKPY